MASQLLGIKTRFTNDLGSPLVGGQVYTYFAGTSTNQDSYSDAALTVPNTNPVVLDDTGSADIFLKGSYRIRVFDKSGRFIEEQDNVTQAASQGDATELTNKISAVEDGLSAANTEIDKVKLDTGIKVTPKAVGMLEQSLSDILTNTTSVSSFAPAADGVADDAQKIQAAIKAAYDNKSSFLVLESGKTYAVGEDIFFNGYVGDNGLNTGLTVLANGATIKLLSATDTGHVIGIGRGAYVGEASAVQLTGNLTWIGGTIDCGGFAGENGFGMSRAKNVHLLGVTVQNGAFSDSIEGGRAFTTHGACRNILLENCYAYRMGDGYHAGTVPDRRNDIDGSDLYFIASITKASSAVITTTTNHNYVVGEYVYTNQVSGMTQLNPSYTNNPSYKVLAVTANTITIDVDTTNFGTYTSSGIITRVDQLNYRNRAVRIVNCIAEECTHSGFNGESANQPATTDILNHNVYIDGLTLVNCGTSSTDRGIINLDNVSGLRADNVVVHNSKDFPVSDVVRGSFQNCKVELSVKVHTARSIVNYEPIAGAEPSAQAFPYGIAYNNQIELSFDARVLLSSSVLRSTDRAGSSIDWNYRNDYKISMYGVETAPNYSIIDDFVKNSNSYITITDYGRSLKVSGYTNNLDATNIFKGQNFFVGGHSYDSLQMESLGGNSSLSAVLNSVKKARLDYRHSSGRWYFNIAGADVLQITESNIMPSSDNSYNLGSAGLRFGTIYAGTGTISTSDERLKTEFSEIEAAEKRAAIRIKKSIGRYQFTDAVDSKGDKARYHFGVGAQTVAKILQDEGLEPEQYAFYCYDEWEADEDIGAGNRYGIRYDELTMFILAAT